MRIPSALIVTTYTLLATAPLASAGPGETAAAAAARGRTAWKAGRIHEACEALAASDQLEAKLTTELELARCYAQDGRLASAARLYRAAADKDANARRKQRSLASADRLAARAPRLHVTVRPMASGLVLEVDGVVVPSSEDVPVDTGPHELVATAPGYEGHASAPVDREGTVVDVAIEMQRHAEPEPERAPAPEPAPAPAPAPAALAPPAPAPAPAPAPLPMEARTSDHRTRDGLVLGGAGVAVLVGAAIVFEAGSSKFDEAARLCPDSTCATSADLAQGKSDLSDGHTLRGVSIGMGIGGAALVAAGAYSLLAPHHEETHVSVHVGRDGAGMSYTARF